MTENRRFRVFLIKLQARALQRYLNDTPVQVRYCKFCLVSQKSYLQNISEKVFVVFLKFYFFICEELQDNIDSVTM